jgi:AraC-like DNA-binding protein
MAKHEYDAPGSAVIEMRQALARKFLTYTRSEGENKTALEGLDLFRFTRPSTCHPTMVEPSFSVFVQGRKLINLGGTEYMCEESSFLVSSIEVPIQSQILEASEAVPFLALRLRLDMPGVQEIMNAEGISESAPLSQGPGLAAGAMTTGLLGACVRLLDLLDTPEEIAFLSPLIRREIAFRILRTPQGDRLRAIATRGDLSNRTAKAISWLRANYTKPLRMQELAGIARMGVSTLHHHFRALTGMSPLQYQKQLRLQSARQRMLADGIDATAAAYEVGYESVSQFSREYSRFFGQPPMRDIRAQRESNVEATGAR